MDSEGEAFKQYLQKTYGIFPMLVALKLMFLSKFSQKCGWQKIDAAVKYSLVKVALPSNKDKKWRFCSLKL